uniref:Uncharacterized protein n=1 Tax=Ditylenchus dipsaci TaxID=166011 RepID=A0A915E4L8_9BILA
MCNDWVNSCRGGNPFESADELSNFKNRATSCEKTKVSCWREIKKCNDNIPNAMLLKKTHAKMHNRMLKNALTLMTVKKEYNLFLWKLCTLSEVQLDTEPTFSDDSSSDNYPDGDDNDDNNPDRNSGSDIFKGVLWFKHAIPKILALMVLFTIFVQY